MDIKKCTKCGEERPATAEYFSWTCTRCKRWASFTVQELLQQILRRKGPGANESVPETMVRRKPGEKRVGQKKWLEENPEYHKKYREKNPRESD